MAKYKPKQTRRETGQTITTKSWFGSHADMVIDPEGDGLDENQVLCQDDRGCYVTYKSRLDNGLADPNRYATRGE